MDEPREKCRPKSRFLKLTLKKNVVQKTPDRRKLNRSSSVIVLDESFDKLRLDFTPKHVQSTPKIHSPITINDSSELSCDELPKVVFEDNTPKPSYNGNVSFNRSKEDVLSSISTTPQPCNGGWSPAQNIICATPKHVHVPSTPNDVANESLEQCSIKKIQRSQKKLLNDLYGEVWKSIPTLFKTVTHDHDNIVSKKLHFDDNDSDKENIRLDLATNKKLYLTGSDAKQKYRNSDDSDKKCKKKLYTEKIPSTPDVPKQKVTRRANTTTKKVRGMTVTQLVNGLNDVDLLTRRVKDVNVTPSVSIDVNRLSFVGSLADNVPSWRCHTEALQYRDNYKTLREQLTRRLYVEFNKAVFGNELEEDMPITWDTKLRSTAGTTTNRLIKNAKGDRIRTSSVKLSTKVVDAPQRLRDTLIHELCHAATWLIDGELRAGHGPLWKRWATRALRVYPELGEISRCHDMEIHFKYSYKCTKCGYSIKRHSKSIDITKKCCGYCRGTFELQLNKKNKDGAVTTTPARKAGPNDFALYVKQNYGALKDGTKTHAQVMKTLGEQFSAQKKVL